MTNKKAAGTDYVPHYETSPRKRDYQPDKKKNRKKKRKSKLWLVRVSPQIGLIALFFVICFSFVAQNVWINGLGQEVVNLNQNIEDLKVNNEKLKLNIASLTSLERVEQSAAEIGMTYPEESDYIYVEEANTQKVAASIKYPEKTDNDKGFIDNAQNFISNNFNNAD